MIGDHITDPQFSSQWSNKTTSYGPPIVTGYGCPEDDDLDCAKDGASTSGGEDIVITGEADGYASTRTHHRRVSHHPHLQG